MTSRYEQALTDPVSVFAAPESLLRDDALSRLQKIEILRRWAYDADELEVAEDEGMRAGEASVLHRILRALEQLGARIDSDHSPPTKQGGP